MINLRKLEWVTGYGERIEIRKMTTKHIINCIRYLNKRNKQSAYNKIFKMEIFIKRCKMSNNIICNSINSFKTCLKMITKTIQYRNNK